MGGSKRRKRSAPIGDPDDIIVIESSPPPRPTKRPKLAAPSSAPASPPAPAKSARLVAPAPPPPQETDPLPVQSVPDDHSRCKLHLDYEGRSKICNAQTYAKTRCKKKANDSVDNDALWESGLLPVCHQHQYSIVRRGECQATSRCGQRCSRPVVLEPGQTQLCSRHRDEPQDCYISKLPTELRLQIFELCIPAGPVPAKVIHAYDPVTHMLKAEKKYGTAASLMRVDKQTCADVSALLYQCPSRPFEIEVSDASVGLGKIGWYDIPSLLVSPSRASKHINSLSKCHLERIRHVKIKITASRKAPRLFSLLVNIRKLRQALQDESKAEEIPTESSSRLAKLEIDITFDEFEPSRDGEFYPSEIFACSRLILQFFRKLPAKLRWSIEWNVERARRYDPTATTKATKMTLSSKKSKLKNMKVDKEDFDVEAAAFRTWVKRWNSKHMSTVFVSTWDQFKELESTATDLMNIKALRDDAGHSTFMNNAHVALETRDSEALDVMKAQLQEVAQEFVTAKLNLVEKIQRKFLLDSPVDGTHDPEEILHDGSSSVSWPSTTAKKLLLKKSVKVHGGTLEEHVDDGRTVYQVITPSLLIQRREARSKNGKARP